MNQLELELNIVEIIADNQLSLFESCKSKNQNELIIDCKEGKVLTVKS